MHLSADSLQLTTCHASSRLRCTEAVSQRGVGATTSLTDQHIGYLLRTRTRPCIQTIRRLGPRPAGHLPRRTRVKTRPSANRTNKCVQLGNERLSPLVQKAHNHKSTTNTTGCKEPTE